MKESTLLRFGRELFELVCAGLFWLVVAVVYLTLGLVIAVPYILVAGGGNVENYVVGAWLAPVVVFFSYLIWCFGRAYAGWRGLFMTRDPFFLVWLVYLGLPIWLNLGALTATWFNMPSTAHVMRELRFPSFVFLPMIVLILVMMSGRLYDFGLWFVNRRRRRNTTPPAPPVEPPPSSDGIGTVEDHERFIGRTVVVVS